ncbi:MAG: transposase, partial [Bacteroidetes bacterium]|nr:transposase [Bacteroidota bacterium]
MPDSYVIKDQQAAYFFTFQIVSWVDLFTRKSYRDIVVDSFNYCIENKNLQVHAWVIMSNHVHCILSSSNAELSDTIRDFKRHTAKQILQTIQQEPESRREWILFQFRHAAQQHVRNKEFQVWTYESHAIEISPYIKDMSKSKMDYIHNNPVENGLVENAEDYLYSSA